MNESKSTIYHRLQKSGQWDEASLFRDEVRKRLKSKGLKKADANEQAWEEMAAEYPAPGSAVPVGNSDSAVDDGYDWEIIGQSQDILSDLAWAEANRHRDSLDEAVAPNRVASELWKFARVDPEEFGSAALCLRQEATRDGDELLRILEAKPDLVLTTLQGAGWTVEQPTECL